MMINSLSALISMRKSRLSLQRRINWSSVRLRDRTFKTTRTAVSICIAGGLAMFSPHDDHNYWRVFEQFLRRRPAAALQVMLRSRYTRSLPDRYGISSGGAAQDDRKCPARLVRRHVERRIVDVSYSAIYERPGRQNRTDSEGTRGTG